MYDTIKRLLEEETKIGLIDEREYDPERSYTGGAYRSKKIYTKISDNYWEVRHYCSASDEFEHCPRCGCFVSESSWHDDYCQDYQQIATADLCSELSAINWLERNVYDEEKPAYLLASSEGIYWVE